MNEREVLNQLAIQGHSNRAMEAVLRDAGALGGADAILAHLHEYARVVLAVARDVQEAK